MQKDAKRMVNTSKTSRLCCAVIGYSARIIARNGNAEYVVLDFISGAAALFATEGTLLVAMQVERFVSQIAQRYREIEPILKQAHKVGSRIKRLRYEDYLEEIANTGVCRVVSYGDAFFVDGKLLYRPDRQTLLVKAGEDGRTFEVL
jgi:cell division protein FtsB